MKIKQNLISLFAIAAASVLTPTAHSQFAVDRFTLDGGGGTSAGGAYVITGTIGQPDAAWPVDQNGFPVRSAGGNYTLVGGFWGIIQDSLPPLKIQRRLGNLVLSWPASETGIVVQSATQLPSGGVGWSNFAGEPTRVGDQFELVIGPALTPPNPIRFFRLFRQ